MALRDLVAYNKVGASTAVQAIDYRNKDQKVSITNTSTTEEMTYIVDAVVSERHSMQSELTKFPVEAGVSVTDHLIWKPDTLTMTCVFSDDPIYYADPSGLLNRLITNSDKKSVTIYEWLKKGRENGSLFSISTTLRNYKDMILTQISCNRKASNNKGLVCDLYFEKVIIAMPITEFIDTDTKDKYETQKKGRRETEDLTGGQSTRSNDAITKMVGYSLDILRR